MMLRGCMCALLLSGAMVFAQSEKAPTFEVASIRAADPQSMSWKMQFTADGFTAQNVPLRQMIQEAYGTYDESRLVGGPAWLNRTKFNVEAKVDAEQTPKFSEITRAQKQAMLQALLAERFGVKLHSESRQMDVYALVAAKNGAKLKPTEYGETSHGLAWFTRGGPGFFEVRNISMVELAETLTREADRLVVDRTGLTGRYDLTLRWVPVNASAESDAPSLYTAVQEQLGLKLDPAKSAVEVLVVDAAEMPKAN